MAEMLRHADAVLPVELNDQFSYLIQAVSTRGGGKSTGRSRAGSRSRPNSIAGSVLGSTACSTAGDVDAENVDE